MSEPIRLRIKGFGLEPWAWSIQDQDGRELRGVVALTIRADTGFKAATCTIELLDFDIDAEVAAVAHRFGLPPRAWRPSLIWPPRLMSVQPWWFNMLGAAALLAVLIVPAWWAAR